MMMTGLLVTMTSLAQDNYLDMNFGVGVPLGDFSENGLENKGYAGPGFMMSFEGNYFLGMFGFTGSLTYGMNFLDDVTLQDDLVERMKEHFPDAVIPPDTKVQFVTSQWNGVNILVGPILSFPVSVIRIEARALGGLSFMMPPAWQMYIETDNEKFHSTSSGQSVKLAYMLGAGVIYQTSGTYGIRLGVDYVGTQTGFDVNDTYEKDGVENPPVVTKMNIPISMFQATLGITYAF
ncbi:MAG: hypothetical protein GWP10_10175 [Nitrospiraceae bacterium]|nr:hypothetical protein [Nitrospiraceae bacterium]